MNRIELDASDGVRLEARWDQEPKPHTALTFCHPHPQHGGTMSAPLMHKVTKRLVAAGYAVLRFNFRGVGGSSGEWSGGEGEVNDVAAAVAEATTRGLPLALAGWSFGAATALRWQAVAQDTSPFVGIAPPVLTEYMDSPPQGTELAPARRLLILGDRDQFVAVPDLESYAGSIGAKVEVIPGSDHFFYFREDRVSALIANFLTTS